MIHVILSTSFWTKDPPPPVTSNYWVWRLNFISVYPLVKLNDLLNTGIIRDKKKLAVVSQYVYFSISLQTNPHDAKLNLHWKCSILSLKLKDWIFIRLLIYPLTKVLQDKVIVEKGLILTIYFIKILNEKINLFAVLN